MRLVEAGLQESEDGPLVAIDLLPFLGAVPYQADSQAYFVVPDGPGALVRVGGEQPSYRRQFSATSYGPNTYSFAQPPERRTPLAAFGVVHPDEGAGVLAVATLGAADTSIEAAIAPGPTSLSRVNFRLAYRRLSPFPRRKGDFAEYFPEHRARGDRSVRYFFGAGEDADWVGMAQRLRRHLTEDRQVPRLTGETAIASLRLRLVSGTTKPRLLGRRFVMVTTFGEAAEILAAFHGAGVTSVDLSLVGWGAGGYEGSLPKRWPPASKLGGPDGLRDLARDVHASGGRLYLEDDYTLAFLRNGGFFPLTDALIQPNLLPVTDLVASKLVFTFGSGHELGARVPAELRTGRFLLNPLYAMERYVRRDVPRLAQLGVDGLELRWAGELLLQSSGERWHLERGDYVQAWVQMLGMISGEMGAVAAQGGNDYVLGVADTITQFPLRGTNFLFANETVPFYPIATHGLVRLYGQASNLDSDPERDRLRRLEYGMLPVYELTYLNPILLARSTYPELHSSLFTDWLEPAAAEYDVALRQLGHTVGQFIVGHRELAPQVFETSYEDGTRVVVNYGNQAYEGEGVRVDALGHAVVR